MLIVESKEDQQLIDQVPKGKTIAVWNKVDLPHKEMPSLPFRRIVPISAKMQTGLEGLHHAIDKVIWEKGPPSREEVLITNIRHKEAISSAIAFCKNVVHGLKAGLSPEFIAMDMRQCLVELGKIIGTNISEDILNAIFSKFCIGK